MRRTSPRTCSPTPTAPTSGWHRTPKEPDLADADRPQRDHRSRPETEAALGSSCKGCRKPIRRRPPNTIAELRAELRPRSPASPSSASVIGCWSVCARRAISAMPRSARSWESRSMRRRWPPTARSPGSAGCGRRCRRTPTRTSCAGSSRTSPFRPALVIGGEGASAVHGGVRWPLSCRRPSWSASACQLLPCCCMAVARLRCPRRRPVRRCRARPPRQPQGRRSGSRRRRRFAVLRLRRSPVRRRPSSRW